MGTIKDLQYKEFTSDTEYNVIHFETKASQVKTTENNSTAEIEIGQAKLHGKDRQAIMNGNFDIWQRGISFDMSATQFFTADRWAIRHDGTIAGTVSRQEFTVGQTNVPNNPQYFLRINPTSASGCSYFEFYQPVENVRTFAGEEVPFAFWAKADNSRVVRVKFAQLFGIGGSAKAETTYVDFTVGTTWAKYSGKLTIPSISGKTIGVNSSHLDLCLTLPMNTAFTLDLSQFQVNKGGTILPFCLKSVDEELRMCKRYFEKSYDYDIALGSITDEGAYDGNILVDQQTLTTSFIMYEVEKRIKPTVTMYSPSTGTINKIRNSTTSTDIDSQFSSTCSKRKLGFNTTTTQTYGDKILAHWISEADFTT